MGREEQIINERKRKLNELCKAGINPYPHKFEQKNFSKEIKEEYCTDVLAFERLGYRDVHRENNGARTHWIALDFKVLVDRAKAKNGEPHKMDEIRWFALDSLPSPMHSQWPVFFNLYKEKLNQS